MATMEQTINDVVESWGVGVLPSDEVFDAGTVELPDREGWLLTYGDGEVELLRIGGGGVWESVKLWPCRSVEDVVAAIAGAREVVYR